MYFCLHLGSPLREIFGVCWASRCVSFDGADNEHGGKFSRDSVNRVRYFFRLLPVCGLAIIYWAVYSQVSLYKYVLSRCHL
jgi:hypothetical protein